MQKRATVAAVALLIAIGTLPTPSGAQDVTPLWEVEDPTGDVALQFAPEGQGVSGTPIDQAVDITRLMVIEETMDRIVVAAEVVDYSARYHPANTFDSFTYRLAFKIQGFPVDYWTFLQPLNLGATAGPPDQPVFLYGDLCIVAESGGPCHYGRINAYVIPSQSRLYVEIPKLSLIGKNPTSQIFNVDPPPGLPTTIDAGAKLHHWQLRAQHQFVATLNIVGVYDVAPNTASSDGYVLRQAAANTKIRLALMNSASPEGNLQESLATDVGVTPGHTTAIPILVDNSRNGKRIVGIQLQQPNDAGKFEASIAQSIEVPDGERRAVTLYINASESLQHRESGRIQVIATSLGHEDEIGFLDLRLRGSVPPSPTSKTLYFHAAGAEPDPTNALPFLCISGCPVPQTWMNTIQQDDQANLDDNDYRNPFRTGFFALPGLESGIMTEDFFLDRVLPDDLHFEPGQPVTGQLSFKSRTAGDVHITLDLFAWVQEQCGDEICADQRYLGGLQTDASIGTTATPVEFSFFVTPEAERLRATGGTLYTQLHVSSAQATNNAQALDGFWMQPSASQLTLPLVEPPAKVDIQPTTLGVYAPTGEIEDFVNSNETSAYQILLVNEANNTNQVGLNASTDLEGWTIKFHPSSRFALGPGEAANVTALVRAPVDADEGDIATTIIEAWSINRTQESGKAHLELRTIVTNGIDLDDEADQVSTDNETLSRALDDSEGGDSPGLGLAAIALSLLVAIVVRRRQY